jgi:hypothetical protein
MLLRQTILQKTLLLSILICMTTLVSHAQSDKVDKKAEKRAEIKNLVEGQNYVFIAQTAIPMGGRSRILSSDADLTVTRDAIVSYLPYFGRAYTPPIDPAKGGIQFTSKDFSYTLTPRKKGGWDIEIKPKDYRDVQRMYLNISDNGSASLQVTSTNRSPISFNGTISTPPPKKN